MSKTIRRNARSPGVQQRPRRVWLAVAAAGLLALSSASHGLGKITSYAFVRDDATLDVAGRHIRLYGIYTPETGRVCATRVRPVRCGSRAAQALRFKIRGFVNCESKAKYADRSIAALCRFRDEDLSAYLLARGWAVALPGAPFRYHVLERIARHQSLGVWGVNADVIRFVR